MYFCKCQKADEKKKKEDEQTLEELNSVHIPSQAKCQLVIPGYIKQSKLFLFSPDNKHLINRAIKVGLYGRILTSVVCTDLTAFGLYLRPRSRFSHTDLLFG